MQLLKMSDYNRGARVYWWVTTAVGAGTLILAAAELTHYSQRALLQVALLTAVVYLAGLRPIRLPGLQAVVTPGDIFVFLSVLFLGAPAATLVAVVDTFSAAYRTSQRWTSRLGSPALTAISIFVSASLFQGALGWLHDWHIFNSATLLGTLLVFSLTHFALTTGLLAAHHALKRRQPLFEIWWSNYSWISLSYTASASVAGLIYLAISHYGLSSLLAAGPLVAIIFAAYYFYFKQAEAQTKAAEERTRASERISRLHLATVEALATAIDAKDQITHDHVYRVQVYACGLARHFGLGELEVEALKAGALLHDVGKIAVPDYILNKPGKLTAAEFEKMKIHTVVGAQILERVNFPYPVVPIVRYHHERWDGRGYPDGLKAEQIPMTARILSVVDCFDAVREDRQYRKGLTREEACQLLRDGAHKQFDPQVVESFLENLPQYEEEIAAHKANQQPQPAPTTQAGLSESGRQAAPAAGLAPAPLGEEVPGYLKQIKAAHTEVAALYEMAQTFSTSLEVRDVISFTVNRLERMVPFTTCVVYLRNDADESAVAAHAFGRHAERLRGRSLKAGHGIAGWVIINGRPMSNTDPMLDLHELLGPDEAGYRTAAVFPLTKGSEAVGALALYADELDSYSTDHLHLLESVARLASTALQHALLYEQSKANAQTDALTGLANGRALYTRFDEALAGAESRGAVLTVLACNIDGLRAVNDTYGYQVGDRVLAEVAKRLRQVIGEPHLVSRLAGDEFVCLLEGCNRPQAMALGEQAQAEVDRFALEVRVGQYARVGLSFGVAEYPTDGRTIDELLQAAAVATRRNKTDRKRAKADGGAGEPRPASYPLATSPEARVIN